MAREGWLAAQDAPRVYCPPTSPLNTSHVRKLREKRGLTQVELANAARIRQATISRIETGKASRITVEMLEALADALDCEASELLTRKRGK